MAIGFLPTSFVVYQCEQVNPAMNTLDFNPQENSKMNTLHFVRAAEPHKRFPGASWFFSALLMPVAMSGLISSPVLAQEDDGDDDDQDRDRGACSRTADAAFKACQHEINDDFWIAIGNCNNLADPEARARCKEEAKVARQEAKELCRAQLEARLELCKSVGEVPYDPQIDPATFVDPAEIGTTVAPNPYFPLIRGRTWIYRGGTETVTVTVTEDTKLILGVTCAVIRDIVEDNGEVIEDTKDWYAQDIHGNVWYFGEVVQDFADGELVSIAGSFMAGVDGAKAGMIMKAAPVAEEVYRQEFSLGNAEDVGAVVSLTGSATVPAASCDGNCLITKDDTPIEPGVFANKYYAPGIGAILEVYPQTGERVELVEIRGPNAMALAITTAPAALPKDLRLHANPNPVRLGSAQVTTIQYDLPKPTLARVAVYDLNGRLVRVLQDGPQTAGSHALAWNGFNATGSLVGSGFYFVVLEAESRRLSRKISVVK